MSRSSRCSLVAVAAALVPAAPALAQAPTPPPKTVSAQGTASAQVKPNDRTSNASIAAAVEAAEAKALPGAVADAKAHAAKLASLAGLTLGGIIAIADTPPTPFGPFYPTTGTFGPGRFCGTVRTVVTRKGPDGKRHRSIRSHHTCRVPPSVTASVTITFSAQ
jgi:uncharacterized protein YggE